MVPIDIPDNWINGRCYRSFRMDPAASEERALETALARPEGVSSLAAAAAGKGGCVVAVDPARPRALERLLPHFLNSLEAEAGIQAGDILVLVANRFWEPLEPADLLTVIPEAVRERYRVALHDPEDTDACIEVGAVRDKLPLRVCREWVDAPLKIVFGPVEPDLVFGFTGGRSVVIPGLADRETCIHLYTVENTSKESVRYGSMRDNPLHLAAAEGMMIAGCDLAVCIPMAENGAPSQVVFGEPSQAFLTAAGQVRGKMAVQVKEPMDIVVTTAGGRPHDSNLLSAINAMSAADPVLKRNGSVVMTASLDGGVGPEPLQDIILHAASPRGFDKRFGSRTRDILPGQWIAHRMFEFLRRHEVILFSDAMDEDLLWRLGFTPTSDLQEAVHVAMQGHGQRCKICALPDGPFSLARLAHDNSPMG